MQDLTQNWSWILIALAVVAFFLLRRGRRGHGGFGLGGHGHGGFDFDAGHGHHHHREDVDRGGMPSPQQQLPESVVDPVSGSAVRTADAITSVYQGRAYYFASKENRDRFEAAPQDYANKVQGVAFGGYGDAARPRRRRHGC